MADSKNYKVNLITDVQDLVNANGELRATSRYIDGIKRASEQFGRARYQSLIKVNTELKYTQRHLANIYSLAIRVGRLRVTPEVYLIDHATPALERLLRRLKEINSYAITARANINYKVQGAATALPALNIVTKVETTDTSPGLNTDYLIATLNINTLAVNNLSTVLASLKLSGGTEKKEEPKSLWENIIDSLKGVKDTSEGVKSFGEMPGSFIKTKEAWKAPKGTGFKGKAMWLANVAKEGGEFSEKLFTGLSGTLGGGTDIVKGIQGILGMGEDTAAAVSGTTATESASGVLSSSSRIVAEGADGAASGVLKTALKGGSKFLGPLSLAPDAINLVTADNNAERGAAIGSAVLGTGLAAIGGVLGSGLPVIGNIALGAGLGAVGSWAGEKLGGWIGGMIEDNKVAAPHRSVTEDTLKDTSIKIPDMSHVIFPPKDFKVPPGTLPQLGPAAVAQDTFGYGISRTPVAPLMPNVPGRNTAPVAQGPSTSAIAQPSFAAVTPSPVAKTGNQGLTTKTSVETTVQLSDGQISTISGMLKDFKSEVSNSVAVNVSPGAVQVTVKENKIDYDALSAQVGQRIMVEVRKALENLKPAPQPAK